MNLPAPPPILLTAFEPFHGATINASREVGERIAAGDSRVTFVVLPVIRGEAEDAALRALRAMADDDNRPGFMISLGEAPCAEVRLEKVAINWDDFRIPDNAGNQPRDEAINAGGPDAHFVTLPVARLAAALCGRTPVPVVVSLSAGSFLCNHLAYCALDALAADSLCPYGFVHVPAVRPGDPTDGRPDLDAITITVRQILDAAAAHGLPGSDP